MKGQFGAQDRSRGALIGLAVGDALGTTHEFAHLDPPAFPALADGPLTEMVGGGPFALSAGQITDDAQMACLLASSLCERGVFDATDVATRYLEWAELPPFDIGAQTSAALRAFGRSKDAAAAGRRIWIGATPPPAANGSLMRTAPIGVFFANDARARREASLADSAITHYDPRCRIACSALNAAIAAGIRGASSPNALFEAALEEVDAAASALLASPEESETTAARKELLEDLGLAAASDPLLDVLGHQGFVRIAFRLAFWELLHRRSFAEALLDVANRGGDADTNCAVAGALLGAFHGASGIPTEWREAVLGAPPHPSLRHLAGRCHPRQLLCLTSGDERRPSEPDTEAANEAVQLDDRDLRGLEHRTDHPASTPARSWRPSIPEGRAAPRSQDDTTRGSGDTREDRPRRLILSRKGFDTSWGGGPSPILPDGRMVPLPIPGIGWRTYSELQLPDGRTYADLMRELDYQTVRGYDNASRVVRTRLPLDDARAHLDPDLERSVIVNRVAEAWRGLFGQTDRAAGHLRKQHISPGDVFLFFGLFRRTRWQAGALVWDERFSPAHVIWGYLEVGSGPHNAWSPPPEDWMAAHPHFHCASDPGFAIHNDVYVATNQLSFAPEHRGSAGFATYSASCCEDTPGLRLTCTGGPLTAWRLPIALHPTRTPAPLTYHPDPGRWSADGDHCLLTVVDRGQEFVVERTDAIDDWLHRLIKANMHRPSAVVAAPAPVRGHLLDGPGLFGLFVYAVLITAIAVAVMTWLGRLAERTGSAL